MGDGRSTVLEVLREQLVSRFPQSYDVLSWRELQRIAPTEIDSSRVLLIDGPPMLESSSSLDFPADWLARVDGALVVVMGNQSRSSDLTGVAQRLDVLGIAALGVIWNRYAHPGFPTLWRDFKRRLLSLLWRRAPKAASRGVEEIS
jgi:hypothetical protein